MGPPIQHNGHVQRFDDNDDDYLRQLKQERDKKMGGEGVADEIKAALSNKFNQVANKGFVGMTKEDREDKKYRQIIQEMNNKLHTLHPYFEVISQSVAAAVTKKKRDQKQARKDERNSRKSSIRSTGSAAADMIKEIQEEQKNKQSKLDAPKRTAMSVEPIESGRKHNITKD